VTDGVRDSFWRGREFTSLETDAGRRGGPVRQRRGLAAVPAGHGAAPVAVFEAVEAEALLPLPVNLQQAQ